MSGATNMHHRTTRRGAAPWGRRALIALLACAAATTPRFGAAAQDDDARASQHRFADPVEATLALVAACRDGDLKAFELILGTEHEEVYRTEDTAADREAQQGFASAADEQLLLQIVAPDRLELVVGWDEWPMPIPLVRDGDAWRYDTAAGADEIISRRVGRNELAAIELCRRTVVAQELYCDARWDDDEVYDYAEEFISTPGKHDGLYWEADVEAGEPLSPLHDFIEDQRDYLDARAEGSPYRGYRVKGLWKQGPSAEGGAMEYRVDGHLTRGWAMIVWPAEYGTSGIMTFIVSHLGEVYQRDLGEETAEAVAAIDAFDPDESWSLVLRWMDEPR